MGAERVLDFVVHDVNLAEGGGGDLHELLLTEEVVVANASGETVLEQTIADLAVFPGDLHLADDEIYRLGRTHVERVLVQQLLHLPYLYHSLVLVVRQVEVDHVARNKPTDQFVLYIVENQSVVDLAVHSAYRALIILLIQTRVQLTYFHLQLFYLPLRLFQRVLQHRYLTAPNPHQREYLLLLVVLYCFQLGRQRVIHHPLLLQNQGLSRILVLPFLNLLFMVHFVLHLILQMVHLHHQSAVLLHQHFVFA